MERQVHRVAQAASGGSHVTIYEADVEFVTGGSGVQVVGPLGLGAIIRISRIVLHPVDFQPRKFEQFTAEELRRLVEQEQAEPDAAPDRGGV